MSINVHLYPSPIVNESRMLRVTSALEKLEVFEEIHLVGILKESLQKSETLSKQRTIKRFGISLKGKLGKLLVFIYWYIAVFLFYFRKPLTCVNAHSVSVLPLCVILKWVTGSKLVYDAHELETETASSAGFRKNIVKWVERRLIGYADVSIFVSQSISDWYIEEYSLKNVHTIYNCPKTKNIPKSSKLQDNLKIPNDAIVFLYQGILSPGRGVEVLISIFQSEKRPKNAVLVFMGYGSLEEEVKSHVGDYIYYHPPVPPSELLSYSVCADFGLSFIEKISVSYDYCMPNKLFEYVMAGIPILVSPTLDQSRFVGQNGVGVVAKGFGQEDIVQAMNTLMQNTHEYYKDSLKNTSIKYCWENEEKKLSNIYFGMGFGK